MLSLQMVINFFVLHCGLDRPRPPGADRASKNHENQQKRWTSGGQKHSHKIYLPDISFFVLRHQNFWRHFLNNDTFMRTKKELNAELFIEYWARLMYANLSPNSWKEPNFQSLVRVVGEPSMVWWWSKAHSPAGLGYSFQSKVVAIIN